MIRKLAKLSPHAAINSLILRIISTTTTKTSPDTALRDIQDLLNKKVLVKEVGGGRSTSYTIRD